MLVFSNGVGRSVQYLSINHPTISNWSKLRAFMLAVMKAECLLRCKLMYMITVLEVAFYIRRSCTWCGIYSFSTSEMKSMHGKAHAINITKKRWLTTNHLFVLQYKNKCVWVHGLCCNLEVAGTGNTNNYIYSYGR